MHSEQAAPDLLQKSLDASGIGWWQLDFGQREMTCSQLAAELFGADRTRISFEEVYLLPGEEHRARIYTRCAALKVSDTLDETFVTANGGRCLQVRAVEAGNDPRTGVRTVFGTVRRITEGTPENADLASINQSYKATQRNYSHLAQLIEHLPIGYLRVNILRDKSGEAVDYLLSYINQQAGSILGIRTQDHAGKTAREVGIDPLKHIPTFEHIPSRSFWEQTGKSPDGKRSYRCLIYNTPGDDDELVILLEDITDATRSREQLDDFENLFSLVSDFAHVGCVNYNLLTGEGYTKGPWVQNYGEREDTPVSQIIGTWQYVHPDDRDRMKQLLARLERGEITSCADEVRVIRPDEPMRWLMTHVICRDYRPEEGVIDLACVNYDITKLKRTEEELREAKERAEESNKLKSAFLANMSHEIRTPLNAIVGFSELLTTTENLEEKNEFIKIIRHNNNLLLQIIGNILNLSKIEAGYQDRYPERFDLTDLFDELKVLAANQNSNPDVMLLCENPHVHCYVQLDKKRFSQVMFNYLTNAIKYTPCGTIRFGYECRDGGIRLYVADTGIGISEANQSRVYQRFDKFDDFAQGTGLGLAIAKALTEAAGGHVGFESHEGKGSIFWSWVPCEISYD